MQTYNYYSGGGRVIDSLQFDISEDALTLEYKGKKRKFKIVPDYQFTYKFSKTQVKSMDGAEGLTRYFDSTNQIGGLMNGFFFSTLVKAVNQ